MDPGGGGRRGQTASMGAKSPTQNPMGSQTISAHACGFASAQLFLLTLSTL